MSVHATIGYQLVDGHTKAALQLDDGARGIIQSLGVLCGGVGRKVRLRCAKPACQRLPPLLSCRMSVMMSRAASEP
jgi:hypothetical protein